MPKSRKNPTAGQRPAARPRKTPRPPAGEVVIHGTPSNATMLRVYDLLFQYLRTQALAHQQEEERSRDTAQ